MLPPLWSSAAKKPRPVLTFSNCAVFTPPHCVTIQRGRPVGPPLRALKAAGRRAGFLLVERAREGAADLIADLAAPVQVVQLVALRVNQLVRR